MSLFSPPPATRKEKIGLLPLHGRKGIRKRLIVNFYKITMFFFTNIYAQCFATCIFA